MTAGIASERCGADRVAAACNDPRGPPERPAGPEPHSPPFPGTYGVCVTYVLSGAWYTADASLIGRTFNDAI